MNALAGVDDERSAERRDALDRCALRSLAVERILT
jgi:hypothetical protein